jgi:hypothetical protein
MSDPLSHESLLEGARKFALSAWHAHNRHTQDLELFVLHAGVSIERLAKAALSKRNRVLLMETNAKEDMLLHFVGVGPALNTRIRTISASVAIGRLRKLGVLRQKDADLDELIELRNGVAHLHAEAAKKFDPVVTFARTSEELLKDLGVTPADYWGRMQSLATIALSEAQSELERSVRLRIRAAKERFEEKFHGMPGKPLRSYRATALPPKPRFQRDVEGLHVSRPAECPACECPSEVLTTMVMTLETESHVRFEAHTFACQHCGLQLKGREEFQAVGIKRLFSLEMSSEDIEALGRLMQADPELGLSDLEAGVLAASLNARFATNFVHVTD